MRQKGFFASHAKSSAALMSLGIHALLLIVAVSFVAVTVIQKPDTAFETRQVNRPKVPLKKLQVPINIKQRTQKPRLRKRIVVKPRMTQSMPDIRMPEISGIKGGLGSGAGSGIGGAGGIGFSMPEIQVFGIKGKGEKIFIALDSYGRIMRDEVGGMRAYTVIKNELYKILDGLPPTAVFNVAVFEHSGARVLFPSMVSASKAHVEKVKEWLDPLNAVKAGMGEDDWGVKTLPSGGVGINYARYNRKKYGKIEDGRHWYLPAALAMEQQADAVFILTGWWGVQDHDTKEKRPGWSESEIRRWYEKLEKAKVLYKKENEERLARGDPPRVLHNNNALVNAYFPGSGHLPREYRQYIYTGRDFAEALHLCREEYASKVPTRSGLGKKRDKFSINVVFFAPVDEGIPVNEQTKFKELTSLCGGELRVLAGLEAIESSVKAQD